MKDYIPLIGIILILGAGYFGFNKLITSQAVNRSIYEKLKESNDKIIQSHAEQKELTDSIYMSLKQQDSVILRYEKKLNYIRKQNNALYTRYISLPPIQLPEL